MKRLLFALGVILADCHRNKPPPPERVELRRISGDTVQLIPHADQMPYCLVFTVSESHVVRQLTMSRVNLSVRCEAGKPIRGISYRIPHQEGKVKIFVFLSDRRLDASSIGQQVYELSWKPDLNVLDLRAPGRVFSQVIDFTPEEAGPVAVGEIFKSDAGAAMHADGGS